MPEGEAIFMGQLGITKIKRRQTIVAGCCAGVFCTWCMLYLVCAVHNVCCSWRMLYLVYTVLGVHFNSESTDDHGMGR